MYSRGHIGIALLTYTPIAAVLLDTGLVALALIGGIVAVSVATLPDVDEFLPIPHRGPTHTIAFAVVLGMLATIATSLLVASGGTAVALLPAAAAVALPWWTPLFVGGVVTLTLCSHIAGDAITPMGIQPFRPLSAAHFTLDMTPAKNPIANYLFLGLGVAAVLTVVAVVP